MRQTLLRFFGPLALIAAGCAPAPPLTASSVSDAGSPTPAPFTAPAEVSRYVTFSVLTGQVSPGAMITAGGGNVISAGGGNLITAGGGNLTSQRTLLSTSALTAAALQVSLLDASGTPVVGVAPTTTDAQGRYRLRNVPIGPILVVRVTVPQLAMPLLTMTQADAAYAEADVDIGTTYVATALTANPSSVPRHLDLQAFKAAARAIRQAKALPPLMDKHEVLQRVALLASDTPALATLLSGGQKSGQDSARGPETPASPVSEPQGEPGQQADHSNSAPSSPQSANSGAENEASGHAGVSSSGGNAPTNGSQEANQGASQHNQTSAQQNATPGPSESAEQSGSDGQSQSNQQSASSSSSQGSSHSSQSGASNSHADN